METIELSGSDRELIRALTAELRRFNDNAEKPKHDTWFTYQEAGEYIGRTRQTISRWAKCGKLHPRPIGLQNRIAKSELGGILQTPCSTI